MKKIVITSLLLFLFVIPFGCTDMNDNAVPSSLEVKDFVWKGMNLYYLWQADVPNLADNRFANQSQLNAFLTPFASPTELFNALRVPSPTDRFSVIFSDYTVLEGVLSGNTLNNGMDYGLKYTDASQTSVLGWVRYIIPNSDAATKDVHRVFYCFYHFNIQRACFYYCSCKDIASYDFFLRNTFACDWSLIYSCCSSCNFSVDRNFFSCHYQNNITNL